MISLTVVKEKWLKLWFEPTSPAAFCLFRILFGLAVLLSAVIGLDSVDTWYSADAVVSLETARTLSKSSPHLLFFWIKPDHFIVSASMLLLGLSAVSLSLGWQTRKSAFLVWFLLLCFRDRNPFILNAGDVLLQIEALLVLLGPAGKMYSLDALVPKTSRQTFTSNDVPAILCEPWAQRLLQFQILVIYAVAFSYKTGATWFDGTAVYYALHNQAFTPPLFANLADNLLLGKVFCTGTLIVEFSLFALLWIKEFRYWILLLAVCMHSVMLLLFNFQPFELTMIVSFVNFVEPQDVERTIRAANGYLKNLKKRQIT